MNRADGVRSERFLMPSVAECEQCVKLHPDATWQRCRMHAGQTGHTVRYSREQITVYTRKAAA